MNTLPVTLLDTNAALSGGRTPAPAQTNDPSIARAKAEEFEAFFLSQVLESMFKGIKSDGMFGGGHGEEMYQPMMMQQYGKLIAERGGIGIADAVMRELLTTQEVQP